MHVIALCGLPGSGKSTLAGRLVAQTGWRLLDRDALRGEVFESGGYTDADKEKLAALLQERLAAHLADGRSVILDGMTFSRAQERARFRALAEAHHACWLLVWLDCDPALARERVHRGAPHPASDRDAALVDRVAARFEPPADALHLDATRDVDALCVCVLDATRSAALRDS